MRGNVFNFQVTGEKELARFFEELPKSLTNSVLRTTAKEALEPVAETAKANVRRDEGELAESIVVSTQLSPRQKRLHARRGDVSVHAGPSYPKGAHGHLVEFGTGPRHTDDGKYVGVMPAQPYMRPAWDNGKERVLEVMRTRIWGVLKKATARLRRRAEAGKLSKSQQRHFSR